MRNVIKAVILGVLAMSVVPAPAYADKYVFYGDRDRHHDRDWKHRRHDHRGHGWGHRKWDRHHHYNRVVVHSPRYVQRTTYYQEPVYSSIHCTNRSNPLGLILGGAAGGILGHQFGKGKGNTAATIGGAVIGSAIGANYQDCSEEVFQQAPVGTPMVWQTADSRDYYSLTPTRDYRTAGRYCREYQAVSTVAGRRQQTYGTACMQPDGSWEIVN